MSHRAIWEYYDRRSLQRTPGIDNAVAYWQGLGVACTAEQVAAEAAEVERLLRSLKPADFLDVGCGPGTFTGMLAGRGIALDQSANALSRVAREHSHASPVRGDALQLPFRGSSFDRALISHLYGLLQSRESAALLAEVRRVAPEVTILDAGRPDGVAGEEWQDRSLPDGSHHRVFRRHFRAEDLASEVGGRAVFAGSFYVMVTVGIYLLPSVGTGGGALHDDLVRDRRRRQRYGRPVDDDVQTGRVADPHPDPR